MIPFHGFFRGRTAHAPSAPTVPAGSFPFIWGIFSLQAGTGPFLLTPPTPQIYPDAGEDFSFFPQLL